MNRRLKFIEIEFRLLLRNFPSVFFAIFLPVGMLLIFGEIYGNEPTTFYQGKGWMDASVSAYICVVFAVTGVMTLPLTISQYRERKILKRFRATPISGFDILLSQVVANLILTLIGILILLIVGKIRYNINLYGNVFLVILAGVLVVSCMYSIGLLIAGVAKNGKSANAISNIIYFQMLFLSGATLPLEMFPQSVKSYSNILPLTHGVKLLRGMWFNESIMDYKIEVVVLFLVTIICASISIKFFKWE